MVSLLRSLSLYWATAFRTSRALLFSHSRPRAIVGGFLFTTGFTSTQLSFSAGGSNMHDTGYLNAKDAAALDAALMSVPGYTLEQLMELAGLSVAQAVYQLLEPLPSKAQRTLIVCGPGNNGGDGLVAARHLLLFGYETHVVYPKLSSVKHPHYINLIQQCQDLGIAVTEDMPEDWATHYSIIVDAIFGFSFHGTPRPPYNAILQRLQSLCGKDGVLTVAVDIPSGWDVDGNDASVPEEDRFVPDVLVSLTVPKLCAQQFKGRHFVGGRFLPPHLAQRYKIRMPNYPGVAQVVEVTRPHINEEAPPNSWEVEYAKYLAEKECSAEPKDLSPPRMLPAEDSWEAQYAAYCAEKEAQLNAQEQQQTFQKSNSKKTNSD